MDPRMFRSRAAGLAAALLASSVAAPAGAAGSPPCTGPRLTLAVVLERVAAGPLAGAAAARVGAAEALAEQQSFRQNPTLNLATEDLTGSGSFARLGQSETTLSAWQPIDLADRRALRVGAAATQARSEKAKTLAGAVDRAAEAAAAWVDLLATHRAARLAADAETLAQRLHDEVARRHREGLASEADLARAAIAAREASLDREDALRSERVASVRLAGAWGGTDVDGECIDADLGAPASAGSRAAVRAAVPAAATPSSAEGASEASPAAASAASPTSAAMPRGPGDAVSLAPRLQVADSVVDVRRAEVASAKAEALPNLSVGAGLRYLAAPGDVSLVAGVAVQVPIFDRNAGAIRAAEQRLIEAQAEAEAVRGQHRRDLFVLEQNVAAAASRYDALERDVLPQAERAGAALEKAWRQGGASLAELLAARRDVVMQRRRQLAALVDYHQQRIAYDAAARGAVATASPAVPTAEGESR